MEQYLDLVDLKVKTMDNQLIITTIVSAAFNPKQSIFELGVTSDYVAQKLIDGIDKKNIYNFKVDIHCVEDYKPDDFLSFVLVILSSFFNAIKTREPRKREKRLDVPTNLIDSVHCNRIQLKNIINYESKVEKFQLKISLNDLHYTLVGEY